MPKTVHEPSPTPSSADLPIYSADLENAMQDTLARLADVELIYRLRREMLGCRSASERHKEHLRTELESVYQSERQPLIMRIADLHDRMMSITLFRTVH
jgi:hypothetical protein